MAGVLAALTATVTSLVLVGRASTPPPPPIAYRAAVITASLPFPSDPLVDPTDPGVAAITPLLYRPLLTLGATAYPVPDLASAVSESTDGLRYTLPIRPGLRWSDGRPITAADAEATIAWVESAGFPDPAFAAAWKGVSSAVAGNDLLLTLESPRAALPANLTQLPILPLGGLSPGAVARLAAHPTSPLPTSGPYVVAGRRGPDLILAANPHAEPAPHLSRIALNPVTSFGAAAAAFAGGQVSAVLATTEAQAAQLLRHRGAVARDLLTFSFVDLLFNERTPGLGDSAVRRAIADAVDRAGIVSGAVGGLGVPQVGPIPAGVLWLGAPPSPPAASLADARTVLSAAGWEPGTAGALTKGAVSLSFTLSVADAAPLPAVAQALAGQLAPLGISVHVVQMPARGFLHQVLEPGSFQLALAAWNAGPDPDVSQFWASTATPPHGYNVSRGPVDSFLDQDLAMLATVSGKQQRAAAVRQVTLALAQDLPAVFLYTPEESLVVDGPLSDVSVPAVGDPFSGAASWR